MDQANDRCKQRDVKFNKDEYVFKATQDYAMGEEVYMNYGSHPNDTLLAECKRRDIAEYCSTFIDLEQMDLFST